MKRLSVVGGSAMAIVRGGILVALAAVGMGFASPAPASGATPYPEILDCVRTKHPESLVAPSTLDSEPVAPPRGCEPTSAAPLVCAPASPEPGFDPELSFDFDRICRLLRCDPGATAVRSIVHLHDGDSVRERHYTLSCDAVTTPDADRQAEPGDSGASLPPASACGDFSGNTLITASDAQGILRVAVHTATCLICVCDVDNSGAILASDALRTLRFAVKQPVTLDCSPDGFPVSWDGGGDGINWSSGQNWSNDRTPKDCDAVTIASATAVVHDQGANGVRSLVSTAALEMNGGSLTARESINVSGLFRFHGATLKNTEVVVPGNSAPIVCTSLGGTLDKMIVDTDINCATSSSFMYANSHLTLNGTAHLGGAAVLSFLGGGEQLLDGVGTVSFEAGASALNSFSGSTLHIGTGITVHGAGGQVGGTQADTAMLNEGTIDSDNAGTLTVGTGSGSWTNKGLVRARGGAAISLVGTWVNQGVLQLDAAGVLALGGTFHSGTLGTVARDGGTVNVPGHFIIDDTFTLSGATGSWRLVSGTISGGTLETADGSKLVFTASGGHLDHLTMNGDMDLTAGSSFVYVDNDLKLDGTATVGGSGALNFFGSTSFVLNGSGTIAMQNGAAVANFSGTTLDIGADIKIHGSGGQVGGTQAGTLMTVEGLVDSDALGNIIVGATAGTWTNEGTLRARDGSKISLVGAWTNDGTLKVDPAGTLALGGTFHSDDFGTIDRSGGTVLVNGHMIVDDTFTLDSTTGSWRLESGTIGGGTLAATDGSKLILTSSGGHLDNMTVNAPMDLSGGSSFVLVDNGLTLNQVATIAGSASLTLLGAGDQLLDGGANVQFQPGGATLNVFSGTTLHLASSVVVHGAAGSVGGTQPNVGLINEGTINADEAGTMNVGATNAWTSSGGLIASNGNVQTSGAWTNSGFIDIAPGLALTSNGSLTQTGAGTLIFEIAGATTAEYGRVNVNGNAALGGKLQVFLVNGFVPAPADTFALMSFTSSSGSFATFDGLSLGNGFHLKVVMSATTLGLVVEADV